jgi:hypothetical protein
MILEDHRRSGYRPTSTAITVLRKDLALVNTAAALRLPLSPAGLGLPHVQLPYAYP